MGGQSFKCPFCERWTLSRHALRDHLKDRHWLKNCIIEGVADATTVTVAEVKRGAKLASRHLAEEPKL